MRVYIIRHAEAKNVGQDGIETDFARTLTPKGEEQARRLGQLLQRLDIDLGQIVSSPLTRARETATLVAETWPTTPPVTIHEALAPPGKADALVKLLRDTDTDAVTFVGHAPFLGELVQYLCNHTQQHALPLAKASIVCISLDDCLADPKLRWVLNRNLTKTLLASLT